MLLHQKRDYFFFCVIWDMHEQMYFVYQKVVHTQRHLHCVIFTNYSDVTCDYGQLYPREVKLPIRPYKKDNQIREIQIDLFEIWTG